MLYSVVLFSVMSFYVMFGHVVSFYVMLRHRYMLCFVVLCCVVISYIFFMSRYVIYDMSCWPVFAL